MTCPLCGAGTLTRIVRGPHDAWAMWRCGGCFAYPILPWLASNPSQYDQGYFERGEVGTAAFTGYLSYDNARPLMRDEAKRLLGPWVKPGQRVLDLGCATGVALEALARLGLDPTQMTGVDVSGYAIGVAGSFLPMATFQVANIESRQLKGEYDLILLLDVIEHVQAPASLLRRVAALLAPAGKIVMTTPDPNSLLRRVFGSHWTEFHPGEHLVFVGRDWIEKEASANGLTIKRMWHHGKQVTLHHLATRLRGYLPWFPRLKSERRIRVNGYDQLAVVLERPIP